MGKIYLVEVLGIDPIISLTLLFLETDFVVSFQIIVFKAQKITIKPIKIKICCFEFLFSNLVRTNMKNRIMCLNF